MVKRLLLAVALLATFTASAALAGPHHPVASGNYPPVELTAPGSSS